MNNLNIIITDRILRQIIVNSSINEVSDIVIVAPLRDPIFRAVSWGMKPERRELEYALNSVESLINHET